MLIHGFNVKTVFLDSISPEEKEVFEWLKVNAPKLELRATVHAKMRVLHEAHPSEKTLAIGQKAAWSTGSHYFVNLVQEPACKDLTESEGQRNLWKKHF